MQIHKVAHNYYRCSMVPLVMENYVDHGIPIVTTHINIIPIPKTLIDLGVAINVIEIFYNNKSTNIPMAWIVCGYCFFLLGFLKHISLTVFA